MKNLKEVTISYNSTKITIYNDINNDNIDEEKTEKYCESSEIKYYETENKTNIMLAIDNTSEEYRAPILLYENKIYRFKIESKNIEKIAEEIQKNKENFPYFLKNKDKIECFFYSKNYVGILKLKSLDINYNLIEVISEKVDYYAYYHEMISDINNFCIEILNKNNSIFKSERKFLNKADNRIFFSKIEYITNILKQKDLQTWIKYLEKRYNSKLKENKEEKYLFECDDTNITSIIEAISNDNIYEFKNRKVPLKINNIVYEENKDTVENKFVKFFINYLKKELNNILQNVVVRENAEFKDEIKNMIKIIDTILQSKFFIGITELKQIPFSSQVLQKKYPYKNILRIYNNLQLLTQVSYNVSLNNFNVGQVEAPYLYEYWCFIKIYQLLNNEFKNNILKDNEWVKFNERNLAVTISNESSSTFKVNDKYTLKLFYQREYKNNNEYTVGTSYSQEFRPDIVLELYKEEKIISILCFDAKYKLPPEIYSKENDKNFINDDLNKMHAYKDGIIGAKGSFILGLGKQKNLFLNEKEAKFPAVGAFSFIPGKSDNDGVIDIIKKFINISVKEEERK